MSDNRAKSCRLSHTIITCNIKSLPCIKLEKIEFAQKLPGHAQILEGSISWERFFFWNGSSHYFLQMLKFSAKSNDFFSRDHIIRPKHRDRIFLNLKFSGMVPLITFYNCWSFQQNLMIFSQDIVQKPHFGPNLGPNLGQDIFFSKIGLRHFKSFIVG